MRSWAILSFAALATTACGGASPQAHAPAVIDNQITSFKFQPNSQRLRVGDTIRWTNFDLPQHTSTADREGTWDSPRLDRNGVFEYKFAAAGTFKYHCAVHPFMHGEVIVEAT